MSHTITAKLNKPANKHQSANGTVFFVSLGEKNYNRTTQQNEWTNYEAALFAKDAQIQFYEQVLVEGAIIQVTGSGVLVDNSNPAYPPKLVLQNSQLGFSYSPNSAPQQQAPQQGGYQQPAQQAPQQNYQAPQQNYAQQPQQNQQQPNPHGAPQGNFPPPQ